MINELPHRDRQKLYAIQVRAQMITRRVFGYSSGYLTELYEIDFLPSNLFLAKKEDYDRNWLSGRSKMLTLFNTMLEEFKLFGTPRKGDKVQKADTESSSRIFIVHGRNEAMKQTVARTIEKIGLAPIVLHEKPSKGRTIIEKFTDYSDVSFAVVLLSSDDVAYPKNQPPEHAKFRARQNVVFELGFFIGKLGRKRVLVLYEEDKDFEMPSDYSGVLYTPYDKAGRWQFDLVKELKACGYNVDANRLI